VENPEDYIKQSALTLGFSACGIAEACHLEEEEKRFREAVVAGFHGGKNYLERNIEKRFDPRLLLSGCRSVIVCLYNYLVPQKSETDYRIAKYALLTDYHLLLHEKLERLATDLQRHYPDMDYKIAVDSAIVSEKNWAVRAGLGYLGKNTLLQTPQGSYFLIGILLTTLPLRSDSKQEALCGNCSCCMAACPTHALVAPYRLDATRCIAFQNIENKSIESDFHHATSWVFGCDICQDVCPHNQEAVYGKDAQDHFSLFLHFGNKEFENVKKDTYNNMVKNTPLERVKFEKLQAEIARVQALNEQIIKNINK
jgi:epoxyqueuosine reductase